MRSRIRKGLCGASLTPSNDDEISAKLAVIITISVPRRYTTSETLENARIAYLCRFGLALW